MPLHEFPVFKTRTPGVTRRFSLEDPKERKKYFTAKAGREIKALQKYLPKKTFVAILLGPKNSGKGTYSKLFMEAIGGDHCRHISVGDIVRSVHADLKDKKKKAELVEFLKQRYRGFISIEKAIDVIEGRDTTTLLPTEIILALVEREIDKAGQKSIFIDGFPRDIDQVSHALYLRALMGYRNDPDILVFINVPEAVIDERMKTRVVCPVCKTPRGLRLLRTKVIGYDRKQKQVYLVCDNPKCKSARMIPKEGDELGIEAIRDRIEVDKKVSEKLLGLHGIPKVFLRNSVPAASASRYVDDYEITPAYHYVYNPRTKKVDVIEKPWTVKDNGKKVYSLLPAAVAVAFIKQIAQVLQLV